MRQRTVWVVLSALVGVSGFSALCYEIIWFRLLAQICGSTVVPASIMAAVFLTGLAAGSWWLGRRADEIARPLRLFAMLELIIGACGIAVPVVLRSIEQLIVEIGTPAKTTILAAGLVLLPPTFAMGGTLPVLCRHIAKRDVSEPLAWLYAANTLGGGIGCIAAGFFLIPAFGHWVSTGVAVVGNLLVGSAAFGMSSRVGPVDVSWRTTGSRPIKTKPPILLMAALTGASALSAEILWTRLFPLFLGNTTHAFALVLAVFLAGLAGGSALYRRCLVERFAGENVVLGLALTMCGGLMATLYAFDLTAYLFYRLQLAAGHDWLLLTLFRFGMVALLVLPPTLASGALFPALARLIAPDSAAVGRAVGGLLFANTLGAVAGSLSIPFVVIPWMGLQGGLSVSILLAGSVVAAGIVRHKGRSRNGIIALMLVLAAMAVFPRRWDPYLLNSGVFIYSPTIAEQGGMREEFSRKEVMLHHEGVEATVAVFRERSTGARYFMVNGKVDGGTGDMPTQVLLGQLPMLVHPRPEKTLVIGLGTGVTLAQTVKYPGNRSDCMEISPGVVEASACFAAENGKVLDHPRVRLHVGDARHELLVSQARYDVIVSEPSNPWQAGNSRLFTRDFYRLAERRLKPGGIFCQWLPIYDLSPAALQTAVATFLDAFPEAAGFLVDGNDLVLLGAAEGTPLAIDLRRMLERWQLPDAGEALRGIGLRDPPDLLARYLLGGKEVLHRMAGGAMVNTDDHNRLEFFAFTARNQTGENMRLIKAALESSAAEEFMKLIEFSTSGEESEQRRRELAERCFQNGRPREAVAILSGAG